MRMLCNIHSMGSFAYMWNQNGFGMMNDKWKDIQCQCEGVTWVMQRMIYPRVDFTRLGYVDMISTLHMPVFVLPLSPSKTVLPCQYRCLSGAFVTHDGTGNALFVKAMTLVILLVKVEVT